MQREDDLDFLADEYADLYPVSGGTAFQHGAWLHRVYTTLAPRRGAVPCVVTVREKVDQQLVAVLPLIRRRRGPLTVIEYADLGVSDYATPIVATAHAEAVATDGTLPGRIKAALGPFDLMLVQRVLDSPEPIGDLVAGARWNRHRYGAHVVDLAGSVDQWRDQLDPSFHRHLTRRYKRLRPKGGSRLRLVTDPCETEILMQMLRDFRATRFKERGGVDLVQDPDYFDFYQKAALDGAASRGPARLVVLEVGGHPAAVALNLQESEGEVSILVGYDLTRLRNYSLGLLIVDQLAQAAIERGEKYLDLTVGDEPYKMDFGARRRDLFEVYVAQTLAGNALYTGRLAYLAARSKAKRARLAWRAAAPRLKDALQRLPGTRILSST